MQDIQNQQIQSDNQGVGQPASQPPHSQGDDVSAPMSYNIQDDKSINDAFVNSTVYAPYPPMYIDPTTSPVQQTDINSHFPSGQVGGGANIGQQYPQPAPPVQQTDFNSHFLPGQAGDDANIQQQSPQPTSSVTVHSGSIESAPIAITPEAPSEDQVEYGYEQLQQIERASQELEKVENKESMSQTPQDEFTQDTQQQDIIITDEKKPELPKVFGYSIPTSISSNFTLLKNSKGKGDVNEATTWIKVLLDRILKRQTYLQKEDMK